MDRPLTPRGTEPGPDPSALDFGDGSDLSSPVEDPEFDETEQPPAPPEDSPPERPTFQRPRSSKQSSDRTPTASEAGAELEALVVSKGGRPGMDADFCKLFRVDPESGQQYDRLAMHACNRQGVLVRDLLFRPLSAFAVKGRSKEEVDLLQRTYETRRQAKLRLVSDEYEQLKGALEGRPSHFRRRPRTAQSSLSQNDGSPRVLDPAAAQDMLLAQKILESDDEELPGTILSSLAAPGGMDAAHLQERHQRAAENLRKRELRRVDRELLLEKKRGETDQILNDKDQRRQAAEMRSRAAQQASIFRKQVMGDQKRSRLQEAREIAAMAKQGQIQARELEMEEKQQRAAEAEDLRNQQRIREREEKRRQAQERHQMMEKRAEERSQTQLQGMVQKQHLHFERRKNIQLHRNTMQEINKIRELQKRISIHEKAEKRAEEEELWKLSVLEKHSKAEERVKFLKRELTDSIGERRDLFLRDEAGKRERRERENRTVQEKVRRLEAKEALVQKQVDRCKNKIAHDRSLKQTKGRMRQQNWLDNKQRIDRVEEYGNAVRMARLHTLEQRTENMQQQRAKQVLERKEQLLQASIERDALMERIQELKFAASNPKKARRLARKLGESIRLSPTKIRSETEGEADGTGSAASPPSRGRPKREPIKVAVAALEEEGTEGGETGGLSDPEGGYQPEHSGNRFPRVEAPPAPPLSDAEVAASHNKRPRPTSAMLPESFSQEGGPSLEELMNQHTAIYDSTPARFTEAEDTYDRATRQDSSPGRRPASALPPRPAAGLKLGETQEPNAQELYTGRQVRPWTTSANNQRARLAFSQRREARNREISARVGGSARDRSRSAGAGDSPPHPSRPQSAAI